MAKRRGYRWRMAHPKVAYRKELNNLPFPPDSKIDCVSDKEAAEKKREKAAFDLLYDIEYGK